MQIERQSKQPSPKTKARKNEGPFFGRPFPGPNAKSANPQKRKPWKSKRRTERPTSSIFSHNKCPTCAPRPHRYMTPVQDMGIPEAGRYPCASYAKVSAPSGTLCTRTYDSKQSTCVRVDEKGPLMRRDPERVTADQSLQHRRDTRLRHVLK